MDELEIIAAALRDHYYDNTTAACACGRTPARSMDDHMADEIVEALRMEGMGVFRFENLGLMEDDT